MFRHMGLASGTEGIASRSPPPAETWSVRTNARRYDLLHTG
jgi:hypothetical protein